MTDDGTTSNLHYLFPQKATGTEPVPTPMHGITLPPKRIDTGRAETLAEEVMRLLQVLSSIGMEDHVEDPHIDGPIPGYAVLDRAQTLAAMLTAELGNMRDSYWGWRL